MTTPCFFVSDLHGKKARYEKFFYAIETQKPGAVFMGGDLLPSGLYQLSANENRCGDFFDEVLFAGFSALKNKVGFPYPEVFLIPGNDDGKGEEDRFLEGDTMGLWHYVPNDVVVWKNWFVLGYAYVPPSPFLLKDWEKYDVSAYVDPGCVSPEDGFHSSPVSKYELRYSTIQKDLEKLMTEPDPSRTLCLFHSPPYQTNLDRAALDGKKFEHVPLDTHVGSIAIRRMIEEKQPRITLHGHVHESARLTGHWKQQLGATTMMSAAHDGTELALVIFDPEHPEAGKRVLL
ncbi:MAG: metallophosphoesterase [Bacteroidales bacterium]|nr:metallophosphoesterase [Bacteroidales bacterium]